MQRSLEHLRENCESDEGHDRPIICGLEGIQPACCIGWAHKSARCSGLRPSAVSCVGAALVFAIFAARNVAVVIVNQGEDPCSEKDLARDMVEIVAEFGARVYGRRSRTNRKLLDDGRAAVEALQC